MRGKVSKMLRKALRMKTTERVVPRGLYKAIKRLWNAGKVGK